MRTEGRDRARWPWLASRPDRALRCPHGRSLGSWYECLNTALDVDSPETPPFSITFSFEALEDSRILSYELQLKGVDNRATLDGGDTGVRLSDRVQFDAQSTSPAVRVTHEGRWIVTAGSLEVDFCYSLQLRGLAAGGCDSLVRSVRGGYEYGVNHHLSRTKVYLQWGRNAATNPVDQDRFTNS